MKTVLLYIGIFIVGFIILLAGTYFLYPYLQPEKAAQARKLVPVEHLPPVYDYTKYNPFKIDTLNAEVAQLEKQIQKYKSAPARYKSLNDSLIRAGKIRLQQIMNLQDSLTVQKKLLADVKEKMKGKDKQQTAGVKLNDVTKSLLGMDEKSLAPILQKLNDNMLVGLYRDGSNMQRQKLLQSLNPDRAAELLKKVTR